ncbi:MAG: 50S ribosomal protein L21 [Thermoflavifilum sp.]|nr:50S ribosomal protein L21 [Thermoflavifilum sp.]
MFAIVQIAGQQFKVKPGESLLVNRLQGNEGDTVVFENVPLLVTDEGLLAGNTGKIVKASIQYHTKGKKVIAFKMKRRKGFRKKIGFRAAFTCIKIEEIV